MKKVILTTTVFIVIVLGGVYLTIINDTKRDLSPRTNNIPFLVESNFEITNNINRSDYNFPSELPFLQTQKIEPYSEEEMTNRALSLGFEFEPFISNDVRNGKTYIWKGDDSALVISSETRYISYSLFESETGMVGVRNIDYQSIAEEFITNFFLSEDEEIEYVSHRYLAEEHEITRDVDFAQTQFIYYNFSQKFNNYNVVSLQPDNLPYSVYMRPDGTIQKVTYSELGRITQTSTNYNLKTYEEFTSSIQDISLMSLDEGNIEPSLLDPEQIISVNLDEIELGYLLGSNKNDPIQPVFILRGSAEVDFLLEHVPAVFYLSAVQNI